MMDSSEYIDVDNNDDNVVTHRPDGESITSGNNENPVTSSSKPSPSTNVH